jgi:CheY-like chemotaxis protein
MPNDILVIEPDWANCMLIVEVLEEAGYLARPVASVTDGLQQLAPLPAALMVSTWLPAGALDILCQAAHAVGPLPIILLTTDRTPPSLPACPNAAWITKPFHLDTLLTTVARCLPLAG